MTLLCSCVMGLGGAGAWECRELSEILLRGRMPSCGVSFQGSWRFGSSQELFDTLQGWAGGHKE